MKFVIYAAMIAAIGGFGHKLVGLAHGIQHVELALVQSAGNPDPVKANAGIQVAQAQIASLRARAQDLEQQGQRQAILAR